MRNDKMFNVPEVLPYSQMGSKACGLNNEIRMNRYRLGLDIDVK